MYISTATKAKALRDWYKVNLGLNRNDISVTKRHEGCLHIEIKNPSLSTDVKDEVYHKAMEYYDVRRDEYTGEILLGGNDYVFVYDCGKNYRPTNK